MIGIKVLLVMALLTSVIAVGTQFVVFSESGFTVELQVTDVRAGSGDDVWIDARITVKNNNDYSLVMHLIKVKVMSEDKQTVHINSQFAPPIVTLAPMSSQSIVFSNIHLENIDALASTVIVIVEVDFTAGDINDSIKREQLVTLSDFWGGS